MSPVAHPVGAGVPDGPHRRTFEYWRTLVYPSVGVGFYPARRLYFAFACMPPVAIFLSTAKEIWKRTPPKTDGFWRRFCPLLPLLAKGGRSGERNIPAPEGAEHSLPEARRRGPPHSSLYPWLRIKFTLPRQFAPPDVPSGGNPVISPLHGGNESRLRNSANSRRTRGGPLRRTGKLADSICAKRLTPRYTPGCG